MLTANLIALLVCDLLFVTFGRAVALHVHLLTPDGLVVVAACIDRPVSWVNASQDPDSYLSVNVQQLLTLCSMGIAVWGATSHQLITYVPVHTSQNACMVVKIISKNSDTAACCKHPLITLSSQCCTTPASAGPPSSS